MSVASLKLIENFHSSDEMSCILCAFNQYRKSITGLITHRGVGVGFAVKGFMYFTDLVTRWQE